MAFKNTINKNKLIKYVFVTDSYAEDNNWKPEDGVEFESDWRPERDSCHQYIAEEAAYYFFNNCHGWEDNWPIEFEIFHDGKSFGRFIIDMEAVPEFSATPVDKVVKKAHLRR